MLARLRTTIRRSDRVVLIAALAAAAYAAAYLTASLVIAPGTHASQYLADLVYVVP